MGSSSDEDESSGQPRRWVPLSQRPEWADVTPLYGHEGGSSTGGSAVVPQVVAVQYMPRDAEVLAYFRAVHASGEKSARALALTAEAIESNPAHYTAWQHRWECLMALRADLGAELRYAAGVAADNPKNYQLWNHRRKCVLALGGDAITQELHLCEAVLAADAKNYHVWAHRQALVEASRGWEAELAFTDGALRDDVRNNSAWSQRMFALRGLTGLGKGVPSAAPLAGAAASAPDTAPALPEERFSAEWEYVAAAIRRAPHNEAAWGYAAGLVALRGREQTLAHDTRPATLCCAVLEDSPSCPPALTLLAEALCCQATAARCAGQHGEAAEAGARARAVFGALTIADPVRTPYWEHRQAVLQAQLEP